jgi:glycosyltransferase involved in cell wall biosynthesis
MIVTVITYIFVAVTGIQLLYYLSFFTLGFHPSGKKKTSHVAVSVIVCAKNEATNLSWLIPLLLKQIHPQFELVLINDASSDNTLEILQGFAEKDSRIKIVNVENNEAFWGNKKYALTLGIKAAKYDHLLFTDADCIPSSDDWITEMTGCFTEKKSIVLGYGKYETKKLSFVNLMVRYETLLTAMQYFSYAKLGSPYMAVGRNLAYTKEEFFRVKGFINHMKIRSGDDDLFIQDAATSKNTSICVHPDGFTVSEAPKNIHQWFRQKRRHVSTASHYKFKHQFFLALFFVTKLLFWIGLPFLFVFQPELWVWIVAGSYILVNFLSVAFSAKKLQEMPVLYFLPFLEIFLVLFQIAIFIANSISKPTHWK